MIILKDFSHKLPDLDRFESKILDLAEEMADLMDADFNDYELYDILSDLKSDIRSSLIRILLKYQQEKQ